MSVQPTYPGVYVQEVPSGVRTIVGVSTSTAIFIGRARQGPLNVPVLCLNISDFYRIFSSTYANSDLARAIHLFFQNGGNKCYAMRIADNAVSSEVTLENEAGAPTLRVVASSPGVLGDNIRVNVTYNGSHPEATFNMEIFRWDTNSGGQLVKSSVENWTGLSMDPVHPRYAATYVNQNSSLVKLTDLAVGAAAEGSTMSGRPMDNGSAADFDAAWSGLIGSTNTNNEFRISVDGGAFVGVDLSGIVFGVAPLDTPANTVANLAGEIEGIINNALLAGVTVNVSFVNGPTGQAGNPNANTVLLRIASANGDVRIEPSLTNDLARALMLGSTQGGIETSRFAAARPAANGIVFNVDGLLADYNTFAQQVQTAFRNVFINGIDIDLTNTLETNATPSAVMFQDGFSPSVTNNSLGVTEKWGIIANAINAHRSTNPGFNWSAQVWGSRLTILPTGGGDNSQGTLLTSGGDGVDIGPGNLDLFVMNVRHYSLGTAGTGNFQTGGVAGTDGNPPTLQNYRDAFEIIDREVDLFNVMVLPRDADHTAATTASLWGPASIFCQEKRAFLIMDAPEAWSDVQEATDPSTGVNGLRLGLVTDHSAVYYPRLTIRENGLNVHVGPSGAIAGLMARIDASRGVWKAPAGTEADIRGITGLEYRFSDRENGVLNPEGINTLRIFPNGIVSWGSRTLAGDDDFASEWKYVPVRRTALFIEESLYRGLKWVVFEPNDEPLWAQIRLNVGAFMHNLFRQGAFQGATKKDAYFVKCDSETTTQNDINLGIVNIWVGFAPLKPAEFVVLHLQQMTGQIEV